MFEIRKRENEIRYAAEFHKDMKKDHQVEQYEIGTTVYNKETGEWKFYPAIQLEQTMRRTGQ